MKIDMLESLGYSFLRHVQGCWIVQTNWKASTKGLGEEASQPLEARFGEMREKFGDDVFAGTTTVQQLLRQAEVDVVGVTADGGVHALEAAFHEGGLSYGGGAEATVRKKMLRTHLVLEAFARFARRRHIWFVSPKVGAQAQDCATRHLRETAPGVSRHLLASLHRAVLSR